jgi:SAM-dependent methyltransferase
MIKMGIYKKLRNLYKTLPILIESFQTLKNIPNIENVDHLLKKYQVKPNSNSKTLDLGCGEVPRNPFQAEHFYGIDIRENLGKGIKAADLVIAPIPFESATFDRVTAFDFIEHIPRVIYAPDKKFPFVHLMNEIWRVLKTDGIFLSSTPIYPFSPAFRDPTHVNFITDETFALYFDNHHQLANMYGFHGSFEILYQGRNGASLISLLKKQNNSK